LLQIFFEDVRHRRANCISTQVGLA
jgi:hypothetical protein